MRTRHLYFVQTGATGVTGGIAALNLNVLHALVDLPEECAIKLHVLSYMERDEDRPDFLPPRVEFVGYRKNKGALATRLVRASLRRPVFLFDHVTLALPVLPFAATGWVDTLIYAHGSEAWREVRTTSQWSFRQAELCLTNSYFTLRKMQERVSGFRGKACPLGLSPRFELNSRIPEPDGEPIRLEAVSGEVCPLDDRVLLLVGRMLTSEEGKGHRALLRALPNLLETEPRVQLVFPGQGNEIKELKQMARQLEVGEHVFFPGFVSEELLTRLYRRCFAYAMPSQQEGFGLVYLEAMNYGKPCIGCVDDGAEDIIVDGKTGLLINDRSDTEEVTKKIRRLLNNPEEAARMGRKGFERLHEQFTARQFQKRLKEAIGPYLN